MLVVAERQREATDGELAARAAAGDRLAFSRLVERHYDFVFRMAFRWCGRKADAEDIAQDVCMRLAKAIAGFRGGSAFTTWLYAVTLNVARDWGRGRAREGAKMQGFAAEALTERGHVAPDESADDPAERLWAAVRTLPGKQREAVTLVYGEGLSHAAAADLMGCAEATVSWHIHEAKKRLRLHLREADEEEAG